MFYYDYYYYKNNNQVVFCNLRQLFSHRGSEKTFNKEGRPRMPRTICHQNYQIDLNHQTESLFFSNILASPIAFIYGIERSPILSREGRTSSFRLPSSQAQEKTWCARMIFT